MLTIQPVPSKVVSGLHTLSYDSAQRYLKSPALSLLDQVSYGVQLHLLRVLIRHCTMSGWPSCQSGVSLRHHCHGCGRHTGT